MQLVDQQFTILDGEGLDGGVTSTSRISQPGNRLAKASSAVLAFTEVLHGAVECDRPLTVEEVSRVSPQEYAQAFSALTEVLGCSHVKAFVAGARLTRHLHPAQGRLANWAMARTARRWCSRFAQRGFAVLPIWSRAEYPTGEGVPAEDVEVVVVHLKGRWKTPCRIYSVTVDGPDVRVGGGPGDVLAVWDLHQPPGVHKDVASKWPGFPLATAPKPMINYGQAFGAGVNCLMHLVAEATARDGIAQLDQLVREINVECRAAGKRGTSRDELIDGTGPLSATEDRELEARRQQHLDEVVADVSIVYDMLKPGAVERSLAFVPGPDGTVSMRHLPEPVKIEGKPTVVTDFGFLVRAGFCYETSLPHGGRLTADLAGVSAGFEHLAPQVDAWGDMTEDELDDRVS